MNLVRTAATVAFSTVLATAGVMAQQPTPQTTQPSTRSSAQQPTGLQAMDGQTVTVTGCVAREADVPGQEPSVVERAGIMRDFILTNVQVKSASPSGAEPSAPAGKDTTMPTGGRGMNVKLTNIDNEQMAANLNKQIEVTGRLDADGGTTTGRTGTGTTGGTGTGTRGTQPGTTGAQNRELPEIAVQNVRVLNQPCPGAKQ